jgi:FMN-dependent oxidoreductase (nitrilotriacetate monooxygenase family)
MAAKPFHLAWFLQGSSVQAWGEPWTGHIGRDWRVPKFFVEMAQSLERAGFDYLLLEDSSYIGESFKGSREIYLKSGLAVPRQDPSVVASLMVAATSRIGIVPTFATFAYPPYLLARLVATLDQVSSGRIGWNMVTGSSDFAARNFGLDGLPEHDLRYDMADEYMQVVNGLWDSWEPGAIVADRESGVLIDHTKVHAIDYEGKFYKSRGPLNSGPCVQGRPVIAQAGGSPRGRQFASQHADTIVASVKSVQAMKDYRTDIRARLVEHGRRADDCKVLFMADPILGETESAARERKQLRDASIAANVEAKLAFMGKITNIDFGALDLDAPLGELKTNGHQATLDEFRRRAGNKTLREAVVGYYTTDLVGTPDQVAGRMAEMMEEAGGDGFLFSMPNVSRRTVAEVTDGLIPELQKRGLVRENYTFEQFRENLLEY